MPGNLFAKIQFNKNYNKLKVMQKAYADENKCDYILFENDNQFKDFKKVFQEKYPYLTTYNIINFYKL